MMMEEEYLSVDQRVFEDQTKHKIHEQQEVLLSNTGQLHERCRWIKSCLRLGFQEQSNILMWKKGL